MKKLISLLSFLFSLSAFAAGPFNPNLPPTDTNPMPVMAIDHYTTKNYLAPNGEVTSVPLYKMVGDAFATSTIDTTIWTASLGTGGAGAIANAQLSLSTGTTANNSVSLQSNHLGRFSGLAPNKIRIVVQLPDTGTANNTRNWGVFSTTDGAFFQLSGTTFCIVTRKTSTDTKVCNGSFNGQYGTTFTVGTNSHFYEIIYQPRQVIFLADQQIIHIVNAAATTWADTLTLPIRYENTNSGGSTTNVVLRSRLATIARFGIPQVQMDGFFQQGLTAGVQVKLGPGNVHYLNMSGVSNNAVVTLYDGTSTAGTVIFSSGTMGALTQPLSIPLGGESFNNGLFLTITGAAANAGVVFD